jgi:hypothetical protein|tara:strand:- start:354 stop:689 length:336 start_codon:yes stop_codon:yes gene_type:complete
MSEFFKSDVVKRSIAELSGLQQQLVMQMPYLPIMKPEQKKEHLRALKTFLEKQKLFFFRISLSDDKDAIEMKERLMDSTKMFGVQSEINTMDAFFAKLDDTIKELEESIDK